jgi:hypothetical protein
MAIGREDYQERKENRISWLEEQAAKTMGNARARQKKALDIGGAIPFGQPILAGHHSEKRHRADIGRIETSMRKAIEEAEKADYYQEKAVTAGKNKAISGDNPEAVELYREKLIKLEALQEEMKAVNKAFAKGDEALKALGMSDEQIVKMKSDMLSYERKPYPTWALSNNIANIHRVKEKIEQLSKLDNEEEKNVNFNGGKLLFNTEINRVQFIFDGKPSDEIRSLLKSHGFRWAPSEKAWQRQRTLNAINVSRRLISKIEEGGNYDPK